jgi:YbgC/YbaW family acyl-CoA thioester hydrolase
MIVPDRSSGFLGVEPGRDAVIFPSVDQHGIDAARGNVVSLTDDGQRRLVAAPRVAIRERVWWSDVDKMGVMFFGRYLRFAERAETEFFRSIGYSYDDIRVEFAIWLARTHVEIDFRLPAVLDDDLVCRAELVKLGAASLHFRFPLERARDGVRIADMHFVVACLHAANLKTARMPKAFRDKLRCYLTADSQAE